MSWRNPFEVQPLRAQPLPGKADPNGELGPSQPDPLLDSERAPPPPAGKAMAVEFSGTAAAYTRLWLVCQWFNLLTLGLYSPWAKVKLRRYLASHTRLGGVPFVYHGSGLPILKGRLLALVLMVGAALAANSMARGGAIVLSAIILWAPWFMRQTFRFDMGNYSWRGIRFSHQSSFWPAARAIWPLMAWPLLDMALAAWWAELTLGVLIPALVFALVWPYTLAGVTHLRVAGLRYGTAGATLDASARDFYKLYFKGMGRVFILTGLAVGTLGTVAVATLPLQWAAIVKAVLLMLMAAVGSGMARGRRFNLMMHRTTLGGRAAESGSQTLQAVPEQRVIQQPPHTPAGSVTRPGALAGEIAPSPAQLPGGIRFRSALSPQKLARLYLVNALWVLATLGLAAPWRRIVTVRLRASCLTVYGEEWLAAITAAPAARDRALGESMAEALDLDLSL